VNKEASHYVTLFGGNKRGNLTFRLTLVLNMKYFLAVKKWCQNKTKTCCQCNDVL